jgi:uncharacterized protein with von Willebrand factor type A (vWA) domain
VLLLDVSSSMSLYSFFWLRLARALCAELADVHAYVFHTRLTPVSDALRDPDPWRAQVRLHLLSEGWGGGTRIGESLQQFKPRPRAAPGACTHRGHPRQRRLRRGRAGAARRGADSAAAARPAHRVAEPRCSTSRATGPKAAAMRAALPHLDLLAAGADVAALERVLPQVIEALR